MPVRKLRIVDGCLVDTLEFTEELKNIRGSRLECSYKERTDCTTRCANFNIGEAGIRVYCGDIVIGEIFQYTTHQEVDRKQMENMALEHETYKHEPCIECIHRGLCVMLLGFRWGDYATCHWKPSHFQKEVRSAELQEELAASQAKINKAIRYMKDMDRPLDSIIEILMGG